MATMESQAASPRSWRQRIARLFTIRTRLEACLIIYALAVGAVGRGQAYLHTYPGFGGWLLALCCTGAVFIAGAKLFDCLRFEAEREAATGAVHPL